MLSGESCEDGVLIRNCTVCDKQELKKGTAGDHNFVKETVPSSCLEQGYEGKKCSICKKKEIERYMPITHLWDTEYRYNEIEHWIRCAACKKVKAREEHTVGSDGKCSVCRQWIGGTEGILYEVTDGQARVVGYEGTATVVRVARTYEGVPVTSIGTEFKLCETITSIILPDTVTSIDVCAFQGWFKLNSITIPDSVTFIDYGAFTGCVNLKNITIPDFVTSVGKYAFKECIDLISITLSDSITSMSEGMFYECINLTSIDIPDSVTTIDESAFKGCRSLTSIEIPNSVTYIGSNAFYGCSGLTSMKFQGTMAQWRAIKKPESWYSNMPINKVVCTNGEVDIFEHLL